MDTKRIRDVAEYLMRGFTCFDVLDFCRRIVADYPLDTDEPAYAEWLLASGFTKQFAPAGNEYYDWPLPQQPADKEFLLRFHPDPLERAESWTVELSGVYADDAVGVTPGQTYGTCLLYQQDFTRGQVRELCRSLRAPLACAEQATAPAGESPEGR